MAGSRVDGARRPRASCELRLPLPGLYNVYNALAALAAALELGIGLERDRRRPWPACGPSSAASRRSRSTGNPVSILLIKNPAGANEVLRTLRLEAGDGGLDLWIALNDRIADGRDVSWVWDADFELLAGTRRAGSPAPARGPPRWRCGSSTRAGRRRRSTVEPRIERLARPRRRRRARAAVRPPHLHRAARAAHAARRPRAGEGVLGVSADGRPRRTEAAVIWHDVECGCLRAPTCASGSDLAAACGGPVLDLGCGTGRVALHLAPPRATRSSASTSTRP